MTMLEEIRAKWCDILVDLLECPVCSEIPKSYIYQCMSGHHICQNCRNKIMKCPICEDSFGKSRNYFAEDISNALKDILTSLMYPTHKINKHILINKICISTQTQEISKRSVGIQTEDISFNQNKFTQIEKMLICENFKISSQTKRAAGRRGKQKFYPKVAKGNYPCCIGFCTTSLPYGKMIKHLKSCHADVFYIFQENNGIFEKNNELKYIVPGNHDLALLIKNMGLFFVNITIRPTGDLTGEVYILNNASASKQFTFLLTIGSGENATIYSGMVKSCRELGIPTIEECLFKKKVEMMQVLLHNDSFNCNLTIKRLIHHIKCK